MTKKDLLENIRDYSPKEIVAAIKSGEVSLYELKSCTHGQFSPLMQRQVMNLLNAPEEELSTPDVPRQEIPSDEPVIIQSSVTPPPSVTPPSVVEPPGVYAEDTKPDFRSVGAFNQTSMSDPASEVERNFEPEPLRFETSQPRQTPSSETIPPISDSTVICPECGHRVSKNANECPSCGLPFVGPQQGSGTTPPPVMPPIPPQSSTVSSGVNAHLGVPPNIKSFSWGGLFLGWIWGVFNGNYWSLILIPINLSVQLLSDTAVSVFCTLLAIALQLVLGFTGLKTAWNTKSYESVEKFVSTQRKWNVAGFIFVAVVILINVLLII